MGTAQQRERELKQKATTVAKLEAEEIGRLEDECAAKSVQMERLQCELVEKSGLLREATAAGA